MQIVQPAALKMLKFSYFLILTQLLCAQAVYNDWDYAIAARDKLVFYNSDWQRVTEEAHQFEGITAIAFNEFENEMFFNGKDLNNGGIHMLRLPSIKGGRSTIDTIVAQTDGDDVEGVAFDPLTQTLFWSDKTKRTISSLVLNGTENKPIELVRYENTLQRPFGLSLDMCRRKLYWTLSEDRYEFSINRMSLDGSNKEKLVNDLSPTYGIAVDQFSERFYIAVKPESSQYMVESYKLDGSDQQTLVKSYYHRPHGITVTTDSVIWIETISKAAFKVPKVPKPDGSSHEPVKLAEFKHGSLEVVTKIGLFHKYKSVKQCKAVMEQIEESINSTAAKLPEERLSIERNNSIMCLDNGILGSNGECKCNPGYTGRRCQTYECHNFCVTGTCEIENGFAKCTCPHEYTGKHCEISLCHNYCLNDGDCNVSSEKSPRCSCKAGFKGTRCELNSTETCQAPCILPPKVDVAKENQCNKVCGNIPKSTTFATTIDPSSEQLEKSLDCPMNKSIIVIVVGVVVSLGLTYLIIQALRRVYKPERPRIRKTFVVKQHKNSNTPLTSRPIATEECQITIENCCNMNICETPCFDPKLLQENMSKGAKNGRQKKEDKEVLLPDLN